MNLIRALEQVAGTLTTTTTTPFGGGSGDSTTTVPTGGTIGSGSNATTTSGGGATGATNPGGPDGSTTTPQPTDSIGKIHLQALQKSYFSSGILAKCDDGTSFYYGPTGKCFFVSFLASFRRL